MQTDAKQQIVEWLYTLQSKDQPWCLFLTITMRTYDHAFEKPWSITEIDKAICVFVRRLDQKVFAKQRRQEKRVGRIVVRHLGADRDNPHYHIVIAKPQQLGEEEFRNVIISTAKRIRWIYDEPHFESFYDTGAIKYLLTDKAAEIVLAATERAL